MAYRKSPAGRASWEKRRRLQAAAPEGFPAFEQFLILRAVFLTWEPPQISAVGLAVLNADDMNPLGGALGETDLQEAVQINRRRRFRIDQGREGEGGAGK